MTVVALVEELLAIVSFPIAAPVVAGSNWISNVSACPGLSVTGRVAADRVKPAPIGVAEFIVTEAVPVEVKFTDCVATEFRGTLPNPTLAASMLSVRTESVVPVLIVAPPQP
jgi:hypothetical protein